jgi:hypothetical protein
MSQVNAWVRDYWTEAIIMPGIRQSRGSCLAW